MNKEQFIELAAAHIQEYLPESYRDAQVDVIERAKNNDILLHGLTIRKGDKDREAVPVIYLEPYYDAHRFEGKDMEDIMHEIARDYQKITRDIPEFDLPEMTPEGIRDKLFVKLVNTRSNQERLKDLVRLPVDGGFTLTAYINMDGFSGNAMIQVTRDLAANMGYDERELMQDAMRNTVSAYPPTLTEMQKVMMKVAGLRRLEPGDNLLSESPEPVEDLTMLILSNTDLYFGATALFYPEIRQQIADVTGGSFYILPSSVHELIILPDNGGYDEQALAQMVRSINSTQVQPEEQLGNKVLYYNAAMDRLMVAVDLDRQMDRGKER